METVLRRNFHTHTKYCGHAEGEVEEYVKCAIETGFDTVGFSCHAPYIFNNGYVSGLRMGCDSKERYVADVLSAKEKFVGQIDVKLGYECEYYPAHFKDTLEFLTSTPCDYLILGQHFYGNEYDDDHIATEEGPIHLADYVKQTSEAMRTGLFTYFAHPDTNEFLGSEEDYLEAMRGICEASLETDTPLEINLLGLRQGRRYPKEHFWRLVGEVGCKVVVGCDAHSPRDLLYGDDFRRAMTMVEKYGLNYTDDIKLKKVK